MILHGSNLPSWYVISIFIVEVYRDESILKWLKHVRCSLGSWKRLVKWIQILLMILPFPPFLSFSGQKWPRPPKSGDFPGSSAQLWPPVASTWQRFHQNYCEIIYIYIIYIIFWPSWNHAKIRENETLAKFKTNLWQIAGSITISIHQHQDPLFEIA